MKTIQLKCKRCGTIFDTSNQAKTIMMSGKRGIMCVDCRYKQDKIDALQRWRIKHNKKVESTTFKEEYENRTGNKLKIKKL